MATKYICDHCGQEFTGVASLKNVSLPSSAPTHNNAKLYELCRACIQALHDYLKPFPIQMPEGKT